MYIPSKPHKRVNARKSEHKEERALNVADKDARRDSEGEEVGAGRRAIIVLEGAMRRVEGMCVDRRWTRSRCSSVWRVWRCVEISEEVYPMSVRVVSMPVEVERMRVRLVMVVLVGEVKRWVRAVEGACLSMLLWLGGDDL